MWGAEALLTKKPEVAEEPKVTIETIKWETQQNKTKRYFKPELNATSSVS